MHPDASLEAFCMEVQADRAALEKAAARICAAAGFTGDEAAALIADPAFLSALRYFLKTAPPTAP